MPFNGRGRELPEGLHIHDEVVYCTECGSIFVKNFPRACPACKLSATQKKIIEQIDRLDRDLDVVDEVG